VLRHLPVPPLTLPSLPRATRGYQRQATDEFIDELAAFYESAWVERKRLQDEVDRLERDRSDHDALKQEADRLRRALEDQAERQQRVTGAISAAERLAEAIKEEARRSAELALKKAREQAEEIVGEARRNRVLLDREAHRLDHLAAQMRSDLMSTLASVLDDLQLETSPNGGSASSPASNAPEDERRPDRNPAV
jgi:cell division septum initiation protein DivIVA